MPKFMQTERNKIVEARKADPTKPASRLAKELVGAAGLSARPFYSIYSVIRRYDAKQKAEKGGEKSLAKTVTNALATV